MTGEKKTHNSRPPKGTPNGLVLVAVATVFVLNFLILGYSTRVALKTSPSLASTPTAKEVSVQDPPEIPPPTLLAQFHSEPVPTDPNDPAWEHALEMPITLGEQDIAIPFGGGSVSEVLLRALHDGDTIAFCLEWSDNSEDTESTVDSFGDAVALQFPMAGEKPYPSAMMGEIGKPVNIWQWRANWARRSEQVTPDSATGTWYPAPSRIVAERFMSAPSPENPCMEYVSEGWGSLTQQPKPTIQARAVHQNGKWKVVFHRSLGVSTEGSTEFIPGENTAINVAVWNGSESDVNGFKSVSKVWTTFAIEALPEPDQLIAKFVQGDLPTTSTDPYWGSLPAQQISLIRQKLVIPFGGGDVTKLEMRAVHNGVRIVFRLNWTDDSVDWENGVDTYKDAVAIQFPSRASTSLPSPLMGERDKPVAIWQWRSDWQAESNGFPQPLPRQPGTGNFQVASVSLTSMPILMPSRQDSTVPCMEFVAAGWGTLTRQHRQNLFAEGAHKNGVWNVIFVHDLNSPIANDPQFIPGQTTQVNFAVWNGSAGDVNGMKSVRMTWMPLKIESESR